jgi:hypothetical protein
MEDAKMDSSSQQRNFNSLPAAARARALPLTARTRYQSTKCGRLPRGDRRRRCGQDANAADAAHTSRAACALAAAAAAADADADAAAAAAASRSRPAPPTAPAIARPIRF